MLLTLIHLFGLRQESKLNRTARQETECLIRLVVIAGMMSPERKVLSVSTLDQAWLNTILDPPVQESKLSFCSRTFILSLFRPRTV